VFYLSQRYLFYII